MKQQARLPRFNSINELKAYDAANGYQFFFKNGNLRSGLYFKAISRLLTGSKKEYTTESGSRYKAAVQFGSHICEDLRKMGIDAVKGNDAPRGGMSGDFVEITFKGDKTEARKQFIREWRRNHRDICYKAKVNTPEFIRAAVKKAVNVVGKRRFENYGMTEAEYLSSRYNDGQGLNGFHATIDDGYRGSGVYRIAISNGKIVATLHGGIHNSNPGGIHELVWMEAVVKELAQYGKIVKADGSGGKFFLRYAEDAQFVQTKEYDVPRATFPFVHHNIEVV